MQLPVIQIYDGRIEKFSESNNRLIRRLRLLSYARLAVFVTGIIVAYLLFDLNVIASVITVAIFTAAFLLIVKQYDKLDRESALFEELIRVNKEEIEALKMNLTHFDAGDEFTQEDHNYSYDLDIFGMGSIFQFINRTCTLSGKKILAGWFANPVTDRDDITGRQQAVEEMRHKLDFRQHFMAMGNFFAESPDDQKIIVEWLTSPNAFASRNLFKIGAYVIPVISITLIALSVVSLVHYKYVIFFLSFSAAIAWRIEKLIGSHHKNLAVKQRLLDKYVDLIKLVEQEDLQCSLLKGLKVRLEGEEMASQLVKRLSVLTSALDTRRTLIPVLINVVTLRDLNNVLRLEKWKEKYGRRVEQWLESVTEIDALSSLAGFAFNYPDYIFPVCVNNKILSAEELGHPLIAREKRVNNDFEIDRLGALVIITGANMAGKSTFLRTLGVNMILAMMGSVVCARNFTFTPIHLFTNMRTKDSLLKDESYFRAELNRLKTMIDKLQTGEQLFVLLDELLKGTNSQDQHLGSVALIEKLIHNKACGCLATHDLELSKLGEKHPNEIKNYCFEVELNREELKFDYKIKEGVSRNMNASFLLKKMGIT